jgi:DEAD/DEAH box helicase domain-containing protein
VLDYLAEEAQFLHKRDATWWWMADAYPAADVTLGRRRSRQRAHPRRRDQEGDRRDRPRRFDPGRARGRDLQVEGEIWKVERFDYENRRAYARRVESDYFTEAEVDVTVRVVRLEAARATHARRSAGRRTARERFVVERDRGPLGVARRGARHDARDAVQEVRFYTRENVGAEDIHLPAEELDSEAFILTLSDATALELGLAGGDRGASWRGVGTIFAPRGADVLALSTERLSA